MTARTAPSFKEFYDFAASRGELGVLDNELAAAFSSLNQRPVYIWLLGCDAYRDLEKLLKDEPWFPQQTFPWQSQWNASCELVWLASLVSQCIGNFCMASANSRLHWVVTTADIKQARKLADKLLSLLERGLQLPEPGEAYELARLLSAIPQSNSAQSLASRKSGNHVPAANFIKSLGQLLRSRYGASVPDRMLINVVFKALSVAQIAFADPEHANEPEVVTVSRNLQSIGVIKMQDR